MPRTAAVPADFQATYDRLIELDKQPWTTANERAKDELLAQIDKPRNAECIAGRLVYIPEADGYAIYYVRAIGAKTAKLVHLPIGDAWTSPYVGEGGTMGAETVRSLIRQRDDRLRAIEERLSKSDIFFANTSIGDVLHYRYDEKSSWVRGKIVKDASTGRKLFKVTALVGDWYQKDLFIVHKNGVVQHGYWAEKVLRGDTMQPEPENFEEVARPWEDGTTPNLKPHLLEPRPLNPPPFTQEEKDEHSHWGVIGQVNTHLNHSKTALEGLRFSQRLIAEHLARFPEESA